MRFGVTSRWKPTDEAYQQEKQALVSEKKTRFRSCLWASVVKRHYLLQMKARYSGMYFIPGDGTILGGF